MAIYDIDTSKQEYLEQFYQTLLLISSSSSGGGGTSVGDVPVPRLRLIAMTKLKIDELMAQSEGLQFNLVSADNANVLDLYINGILDESGKHVLQTAPKEVLIPTVGVNSSPVFVVGSEDGFIYLPDDYLRYIAFRISGWKTDGQLITSQDPRYALQGTVLKGGSSKPIVVITSRIKTNVPVAQVDTILLVGLAGTAQISGPGGLSKGIGFNVSLSQTAADFVSAHASAYLNKGIVLTRDGAKLIFTAAVAGTAFDHPFILTLTEDLSGDVSSEVANLPTKEGKKVLEYYSDPSKAHTIDRFLYIANVGAEHVQENLYDAVTWMAASKLLQIWGQVAGNSSYAEKAMSQIELSYKNLML
jgi:hypothetical protein